MAWLIDQILNLLNSDAGNLTYHLAIAFSIAGSLQIAIHQSSRFDSPLNRRTISGLALLLALQAAQFVLAGFAWQGLLDLRAWLPLLARIFTLIDLVILLWMWAFPKPDASGDPAALALGVITFAGAAILVTWWYRANLIPSAPPAAGSLGPVNGSALDVILQATAIVYLALGLLLLASRRPLMWGFGLTMLAILAAGHVAQLVMPARGGDYPTILHLFQMAAFPFLLILPQRALPQGNGAAPWGLGSGAADRRPDAAPQNETLADTPMLGFDSQIIRTLLGLMEDLSETQASRRIAVILSTVTQADFVSIVSPADTDGLIHILCSYERSAKRFIEGNAVEAGSLPILNSCLKMGRMRRLSASSSSPDRQTLEKKFDLEQVGAMLFVPVLSAEGTPLSGAVLVAQDNEKDWTLEEQEKIGLIVKFLLLYLSQTQEMARIHNDLTQTRRSAIFVQEQAQQVYDEQRRLRDTITVLKEQSLQEKEPTSTIFLEVEDQVAVQQTIRSLQLENQRLALSLSQADERVARSTQALETELKLTLQEISHLRAALEGGQPLGDSSDSPARRLVSETQLERMAALVEDLRRPLASMTGYTELLLDEPSEALPVPQREYVERIKQSTGRFSQLLDDFAETSNLEPNAGLSERVLVDVREVIEKALQDSEDFFEQRRIDLQVRLPDHELPVLADPEILRLVLLLLLENAARVTPEAGQAGITAWLEKREAGRGYLFVQVQDQGGGMPLQEIPQQFMSRLELRPSDDLGQEAANLVRLKTTLEQMGGRIWVESEPGVGLVFSILLPVAFIPEMDSSRPQMDNSREEPA